MKKIYYNIIKTISIIISFTFLLNIYINKTYKNVYYSIRQVGFFSNLFVNFNSKRSLISLSKRLNKLPKYKFKNCIIKEDISIKTSSNTSLRLIKYRHQDTTTDAACLLWLHGGGYAISSLESSEGLIIEKFITDTNTVIIAPDYTLSTSSAYPTALNECYDALIWINKNAAKLGCPY